MTNWNEVIKSIFPVGSPTTCVWTDHKEIIEVLNKIGSFANTNHMFYPKSGGLDLKGSSTSFESNCIEIKTSFNEVISPISLTFNSFENDDENDWTYFRIDLNEISQTDVYNYDANFQEELTELEPLYYVGREHWDEGEFNDEKLPETARLVIRRLKGALVIFGKLSSYNKHSRTYDGRHNNYDESEFRDYIQSVINKGWDR